MASFQPVLVEQSVDVKTSLKKKLDFQPILVEQTDDVKTSLKKKLEQPLLDCIKRELPDVAAADSGTSLTAASVEQIKELLEHDNHETRRGFEKLMEGNPLFVPYFNLSLDEEREKTFQMLKEVCGAGLVSVRDFEVNPMNIFTTHQALGQVYDGSLATKFTVQFNLFGGTVFRLGSDAHRSEFPEKIDTAELVGCFGLSELGYGNNAVQMETTATYCPDSQEFEINSPSVLSQKYWITNGACHAHICVVFAQLRISGKEHGVHGFMVPIRDENLKVLPGCRVEDMGVKMACNGIDNAKLFFNKVRVPRAALLSRMCQVDADGTYHSEIPKLRDRFLVLADQLLSGRLCIASMMLGSTSSYLTNTIFYCASRMGLGPSGKSDTPILNYQLVQHRVFKLLARHYAVSWFFNYCKRRYALRYVEKRDEDHAELIILCSAVKPMSAWLASDVTNVCREVVGGVGFLQANGFTMGSHAGMTAEGDARVLCMKLVKELGVLIQSGRYKVNIAKPKEPLNTLKLSSTGPENCVDELADLLELRLGLKATSLAASLQSGLMSEEMEGLEMRDRLFSVQMDRYSAEIQQVAEAYMEANAMRQSAIVVSSKGGAPELYPGANGKPGRTGKLLSEPAVATLGKLAALYGVECLQKDAFWFIQNQILTVSCADMQKHINKLCKGIRPDVIGLTRALGIFPGTNYTPMAKDWQEFNKLHNFGEVVSRL